MTREENILNRLNQLENRVKYCLDKDNLEKVGQIEHEICGMLNMAGLLGYRVISEEGEFYKGMWIYKHTKIEDVRR